MSALDSDAVVATILGLNEYPGHAVRDGAVYRVTFKALGASLVIEADAAQGPDFPLPQNADVIVRVGVTSRSPTLFITPNLGVVIASAPSDRQFTLEPRP